MKISREQVAGNRERILQAAAALFRERGFDDVGVAEIMQAAGLTHGGFYGHFASKDDLVAQACDRAITASFERWARMAEGVDGSPLPAFTDDYLTPDHRDHPEKGCLIAALGSDIGREGPTVRHALTERLRAFVDAMARRVPGRSQAAKREKMLAAYSTMIGAMVLARAVDDPALSDEILRAASATV